MTKVLVLGARFGGLSAAYALKRLAGSGVSPILLKMIQFLWKRKISERS
ncbi:hypothetical protein HFC64_06695 [Saccharolobus solfataricus]|uniref:Uncharacterized protein n=1 Tax=Saccharolobus solfataricus TaxID=2287 RepID=A0A7S9NPX0_SACSO|nr:hypothetical protein [Saccharolobus solfataricus]QPG48582.1 hypothetical protein HFC64_06695 [Saccharolobus solfataricus]